MTDGSFANGRPNLVASPHIIGGFTANLDASAAKKLWGSIAEDAETITALLRNCLRFIL